MTTRLTSIAIGALLLTFCRPSLGSEDAQLFTHELTSDRVDGQHRDLQIDLAPIEIGPLIVVLSSPTHSLEVLEHRLSLGSAGDGTDVAALRARYRGRAHLVADLEVAGMASQVEDHIELPLQETVVEGRVEIARVEGGYRVTALEAPSHVEIRIDSDMAGQLGLLCRGFAILTMGSVDCGAIDQALSVLRVPLPEPGEEYFIAGEDLTEHERRQLEDYLGDRSDQASRLVVRPAREPASRISRYSEI